MKTDPIFYRLFKELPDSFFELIGCQPSEANAYEFAAVELKQTAFRIDGVFLPSEKAKPVYFVEVQFQKDPTVYSHLFAEIFLYLDQNDPTQNWQAVVIFARRSLEPNEIEPYQGLLNSGQVHRVYLDELRVSASASIGIKIIKLVTQRKPKTATQARQLIAEARQQIADDTFRQQVIELIETVVLYKFPQMSREDLEAMLGLNDLKQTRFAQEMLEEGKLESKLEAVPRLLALGLTMEQVAEALELSIEQVRQAAK